MNGILLTGMLNLNSINKCNNNLNPHYLIISGKNIILGSILDNHRTILYILYGLFLCYLNTFDRTWEFCLYSAVT